MNSFQQIITLSENLERAILVRDSVEMARLYGELEATGEMLQDETSFCNIRAYFKATEARIKYKNYNNFYESAQVECSKAVELAKFISTNTDDEYSDDEIAEIGAFEKTFKSLSSSIPEKHRNVHINRYDTLCTLCRQRPANKTGSHMVPNFLAHPAFSFDGEGKRGREALYHDCLNANISNSYYGPEVPEWRFAAGEGKEFVSDEEIENNINQLEFDNEFCSICEDRFGLLETEYAQYYNGQKKSINPRLSYLFWISVIWRMSMGSMGVFLDIKDELELRKILDENIEQNHQDIIKSKSNLGNWRYAKFRAEGLRDGDKGILGSRQECSPYVVMCNDLVLVFFNDTPSQNQLSIGPIKVDLSMLNDWCQDEKETKVDRRWFWNVRDWIVESSEELFDPSREKIMLDIREQERSKGSLIPKIKKDKLISQYRLANPPNPKFLRIRKLQRIAIAWAKSKDAKSKGEEYDPLKDDELFLQSSDFDKYYEDLARLSRVGQNTLEELAEMPYFKEARECVPQEQWNPVSDSEIFDDNAYAKEFNKFINTASPNQLRAFIGEQENVPERNPFKHIGRNDPCPCGSGKKFKNCHGK